VQAIAQYLIQQKVAQSVLDMERKNAEKNVERARQDAPAAEVEAAAAAE
jgi:hypothetical protein